MEHKPIVKNITIYPVKSLDGIPLQRARLGPGGCLLHDREYAIFDANDRFVNGKANARVHSLRSTIDFSADTISFRQEGDELWHTFQLQQQAEVDEYLTAFFNQPVRLIKNTAGEFLDVPVKSGVTVLSTSSLQTVTGWFTGVPLNEARERFRANIEIAGVPAFWEDRLFCDEGTAVEFSIGDVLLYGLSPRARCVVPTRHPQNGETIRGFQKSFAAERSNSLPEWSSLANFGHSYYLSVDCYVPPSEFGKWIALGDELTIREKRDVAAIINQIK